jgi:hypothetical protein
MNRQFRTLPIPIVYADNDELIHTTDHPICSDITCPCRTAPGAFTRRFDEVGSRAITEVTTTQILPRQRGDKGPDAPMVIEVTEIEAPRKKRWWKRFFCGKL